MPARVCVVTLAPARQPLTHPPSPSLPREHADEEDDDEEEDDEDDDDDDLSAGGPIKRRTLGAKGAAALAASSGGGGGGGAKRKRPAPSAASAAPAKMGGGKLTDAAAAAAGGEGGGSAATGGSRWLSRGEHDHNKFPFLQPARLLDASKRRPDHPEYDSRTLFVPPDFLKGETPAKQQWWQFKMHNFDTLLLFKQGKVRGDVGGVARVRETRRGVRA